MLGLGGEGDTALMAPIILVGADDMRVGKKDSFDRLYTCHFYQDMNRLRLTSSYCIQAKIEFSKQNCSLWSTGSAPPGTRTAFVLRQKVLQPCIQALRPARST